MNYNGPSEMNELSIIQLLDKIPIFFGIGLTEKYQVARESKIQHVAKNQIIIEQDELSNNLFIIVEGKVDVLKKNKSHNWIHVTTLEAGDYFGEIALLRNIPRTARVTTLTDCIFLTINGHDFLKIYQFFPAFACDNIQLMVAKRLTELKNII